ncbi:MAG: replication protein RepA [Thermoanaerobaculia bacterium]
MLTTVRIASARSWTGPFGTPLPEPGDRIGRAVGRDFLSPVSCAAGVGYTIAHKHQLWWSPRESVHQPLWNSIVVLSAEFYADLVAHVVPIDLRALKALRGSPLALDIYSWLTYRMS